MQARLRLKFRRRNWRWYGGYEFEDYESEELMAIANVDWAFTIESNEAKLATEVSLDKKVDRWIQGRLRIISADDVTEPQGGGAQITFNVVVQLARAIVDDIGSNNQISSDIIGPLLYVPVDGVSSEGRALGLLRLVDIHVAQMLLADQLAGTTESGLWSFYSRNTLPAHGLQSDNPLTRDWFVKSLSDIYNFKLLESTAVRFQPTRDDPEENRFHLTYFNMIRRKHVPALEYHFIMGLLLGSNKPDRLLPNGLTLATGANTASVEPFRSYVSDEMDWFQIFKQPSGIRTAAGLRGGVLLAQDSEAPHGLTIDPAAVKSVEEYGGSV